jgi:acyl-CoA reductase-like NAD-dependent aldehyde dehydrogenase
VSINGHWTEVQFGEIFDTTNRPQEKSIGKVLDGGREETLKAIEATHAALLLGHHWPRTKGPVFLMMRTKFGGFSVSVVPPDLMGN